MVPTLQAKQVTLRDLIETFQIQLVRKPHFFPEWQENLTELSDFEKQFLDKVKAGYFNPVPDHPVAGESSTVGDRGNQLYAVLKIFKRISQL